MLSWVANNTAKLCLSHPPPYQQLQCWTLISTNSYGQKNKVPQERVPPEVADKVAGEMVAELGRLLGQKMPEPVFYR